MKPPRITGAVFLNVWAQNSGNVLLNSSIDLYWVNVWRVAVDVKGILGQQVGDWNFSSKVFFSTAEMQFKVKK